MRRFSTEWDRPWRGCEYVLALRAIFRAFQGEEKLSFTGEFYAFTLITAFFTGGPMELPDIPIHIAGVNERTRPAGRRGVRRVPRAPVPLA